MEDQPRSQVVRVYGRLRERSEEPAYRRTLTEREVQFRCQRCQAEVTELRFPGPLPRYCPFCREERRAEAYEERVRKQREKRRKQREQTGP